MRLRITKVDEYQFLTCVKYGLWGSKSARFKNWQKGDYLAFILEKKVAGLAQVQSDPFYSQTIIWDNGMYPNRIKLDFKYLFEKKNRPPILGTIRDTLMDAWSTSYGWGILNQELLDEQHADPIINEIKSRQNNKQTVMKNLDSLLIEAKQQREIQKQKPKGKRGRPAKEINKEQKTEHQKTILKTDKIEETLTSKEESAHSKA